MTWIVYLIGVGIFLISGSLIVAASYKYSNNALQYSCEVMNIVPSMFSVSFLIDSLRRVKKLASGTMHIETWQMVWHIWSFISVVIAGIMLSVATLHAWQNPKWFYATYLGIICLLFICELPFLWILNKIVSQAVV